MNTFDVGIVGAGVHGVTAAYHLARRGVSTVVFERGRRAGGPTGDASGVVRAYYTNRFLAEVARDSTAILAGLPDSGYVRTGGLYLHDAADTGNVPGHEVLAADELAERFPELNLDGTAFGVWERHAGYADPHGTALGYAARAEAHGATVLEHAAVCQLAEGRRSVKVLVADGSGYEVGRLLVAAGPWTGPLLGQLGVVLPLTAERHVVAGLRQAPGDAAVPYVLIDIQHGYYSRPADAGGFLLGPLAPTAPADPDHFAADVTGDEFAWLATRAARRAPVRARAAAGRSWASLYDVSPDWQPVTGRVGERVYVDAGTSGHGFKLAPVWGDHVARLLLDDPDPRLGQFAPDRFAAGAALASGFGAARILG